MPIFEYKCDECGRIMEFLVLNEHNKSDLNCKFCGSDRLIKMLSDFSTSFNTSSQNSGECCGVENPCSDPKKCCERR